MNNSPASVSILLEDLKKGNEEASSEIWRRYMKELIAVSQKKLGGSSKRHTDEEDVAICAFNAFLMGVRNNRFDKLNSRHDLWQVLVMLTDRKAVDQIRRQKSQKRGAGQVRGESIFEDRRNQDEHDRAMGIASVADLRPTPEFATQFREEVQNCLSKLSDKELGSIVLLKLEGFTNQEIADRLELSVSTIERKLRVIRKIWTS